MNAIMVAVAILLRIVANPLANVAQKKLTTQGRHPLIVNFLTYLGLSFLCIYWIVRTQWNKLPATFWAYSIAGGIVGALGNGFLVKALQQGDLSVLGPVNAYKSVVALIVGIFLLGEWPNHWALLGISLIVWGSYFVLDTTAERFSRALFKKPEIRFRIWAMVLTAIEAVFTKKVIEASGTMLAFVSWCVLGAVFSFLFLQFTRLPLMQEIKGWTQHDYKTMLFLLACVAAMQATTNLAFAALPVAYVLALFQLSILLSVWLGKRFFDEKDIRKKMIGAAIMLAGAILIILLK